MKEDARKEDQTNGQSLNVSQDTNWTRCPICNQVWRTCFRYPWYAIWDVKNYYIPRWLLPEQLCPVHVEEIVVDGRGKGKRIMLNQNQLNEMTINGLHCPVCTKKDLEFCDHGQDNEFIWTCKHCKASIITKRSSETSGKLKIKFCSFRKDLGKRKVKKLFQQALAVIDDDTYMLRRM